MGAFELRDLVERLQTVGGGLIATRKGGVWTSALAWITGSSPVMTTTC
jgi:hypothetical protein